MWRIVRLGLPAAGQNLLEVGIFAMASALAGRITPTPLAAHQIVLNIVGLIFMVPFGFGPPPPCAWATRSAAAILRGARRAGWAALALATCADARVGVAVRPGAAMAHCDCFTHDAGVLDTRRRACCWSPRSFSCSTACRPWRPARCAGSAIRTRHVRESRRPLAAGTAGRVLLCFRYGFGVQGLWMGLAFGLIFAGVGAARRVASAEPGDRGARWGIIGAGVDCDGSFRLAARGTARAPWPRCVSPCMRRLVVWRPHPRAPAKFLAEVNDTMLKLGVEQQQAGWVYSTFITQDTEALNAAPTRRYIDAIAKYAKEAAEFDTRRRHAGASAGSSTCSNCRSSSSRRPIRRRRPK